MILRQRILDGIVDGTVTLAFRRWRRPMVKPGGRMRTAVGVLAIEAVEEVDEDALTNDDARRAGLGSRDELIAALHEPPPARFRIRRSPDADDPGAWRIYRVTLRFDGADPRIALRERSTLSDEDRATLERRLARLDAASRHGAWTTVVLQTIEKQPGVRAATLAAALERDTPSFKLDVRKLKELGLTESLEIGYRLSPRGRAWLASQR